MEFDYVRKLERALNRACELIEGYTGSCPYDSFDYQPDNCIEDCEDNWRDCWKKYLMREEEEEE